MATILLSAAGAAVGAGFGGTVLGLSGAVIGRAVGATLGRVIDQRLLGSGSDAVEIGRIDRFRLMGASEGAAGRAGLWPDADRRAGDLGHTVSGNVTATRAVAAKGRLRNPEQPNFPIRSVLRWRFVKGRSPHVGRIWADGAEMTAQTS